MDNYIKPSDLPEVLHLKTQYPTISIMKTAVAFLLVALSCCFDSSAATKMKRPCIKVMMQRDAPAHHENVHDLLCLYQQGKVKTVL
ncbi:hypothetical protein FKM82_023608 [Ascaphus truei]